ncbi:hypothetical protein ACS3YM_14970 [Nocardia sp. N13]|uniref:hypothetical protein n=1 Tax=Nocardioides sp. N13(2025) TaxID=3453405 RepID=UPI003F77730F
MNIKYGIISSMLSDYTRAPEDTDGMHGPADTRSIAYNPKKGSALLEQIRSAANEDIDWRPIQGMSASQVFELLHGTSLYLDTGNHPGKDRLPREAALAGAVTLAVRRGSAAFDQDVPIPTSHKFNPGPDAVQHAVTMIEDVFADLEGARRAQASYRNTILREKAHFDAEVSALFIERAQPADRYRIA